jgi:DNA-binding transcriptional MocR family regulator
MDAAVVAERARVEEELIIAPGRIFEVAGDEEAARFPRNVRLSFSWVDEEDIVEGVKRLGRVLRRMLDGAELKTTGKGGAEAGVQVFK